MMMVTVMTVVMIMMVTMIMMTMTMMVAMMRPPESTVARVGDLTSTASSDPRHH